MKIMSSNYQCPGLINSSTDQYDDKVPLRVAVYRGCDFTAIDIFNIIIKELKRPFVITYCDSYDGLEKSIINELVNNRSDFSPNWADVNHDRYQMIQYTPPLYFANAITILSGKIFSHSGNGFSIMSSFSLEIWLSLFAMIIVVAICTSILHKEFSNGTMYSLDVVGHFLKLWAVFINQSNQFGNICCVKHLILNSVIVISLFVMSLLLSSEILSKLLLHQLVKINNLDDLVEFVTKNNHIKLISDNLTQPWSIMRDWPDERGQFIFHKMTSVKYINFDYKQVYHGESILIFFDKNLKQILKLNPDLSFHISSDRLFSKQQGFLYSKHIDIETKRYIDTIISSLVENGIYKFVIDRTSSNRLDILEDDPPQTISMPYFKRVIIFNIYIVIVLIFTLNVEILLFIYNLFINKIEP